MECDVAIIGGGLAGLTAANLLHKKGINFQLFEASTRFGGRIATAREEKSGATFGDLGATWVWPQYQPIIADALMQLGISTYPQYKDGNAVLDMHPGESPTFQPLPGQHGIARIVGGPQAIIDALVKIIPNNKLHISCGVEAIERQGDGFALRFSEATNAPATAKALIIAAPLRLVAQTISWNNLLSDTALKLMQNTPTWMATQAKVLINYKTAFWRKNGLSGRVASQVGPIVEMHDHCGENGEPAALFGFIGWSPQQRQEHDLESAIKDQLVRCFGPEASQFTHFQIMDWARDENICSNLDLKIPPEHPQTIDELARQGFCDEQLFFAVSETAVENPGLIDGAIEAGARAANSCQLSSKTA